MAEKTKEQQQNFFEQWTNMAKDIMKTPVMENIEKMYQSMMPNYADWAKQFTPTAWMEKFDPQSWMKQFNPSEWFKFDPVGYFKSFQDQMASFPGFAEFKKVFANTTVPGFDVYSKLFEFWKGLENPATFVQNYSAKYNELMQEFLQNFFPTGASQYFVKPQELIDACVNFYNSVMKPWLKVDDKILERIYAGDKTAYLEFFKEVNGKFDESFGQLFNMMGFGINRESYEEQMHAIGSYYKTLFQGGELSSLLVNTSDHAMKVLLDEYQKLIASGKNVSTFMEFYKLWYEVNEEALTQLFNTDDFSKAFANFTDAYSAYTVKLNKVLERSLASLPIPTKTDMDALYKTVYELRKDVRDLKKAHAK